MTHSIDFEALRARRAEGILYGFDAPEAADWLDDWGGLHTLDDGHPGSYDHEALATTDSVTVTLTCQCGEWSGSAPADTDEEPADLFGAWEAHVHTATGRTLADDERCPCGAVPEDGAPWCSYEHYLKYDLVNEADDLRAERDRLADVAVEAIADNAILAAEVVRLRSILKEFTTAVLADAEGEVA